MSKNKSKEELAEELKQKTLQKFLEDIEKVNEKHNMRLVPVINYTPQGAFPVFNVEDTTKVEYKKADEQETDSKSSKDNKGTKD